jgi:hypothetical protein
MKRDFFKKTKRKCYKELKSYYKKMGIIYKLFNDIHITDCEHEIFTFIQLMPFHEIEKMFDEIIINFYTYDLADAIYEPTILKFAIMAYIQKIRNGEKIET